MKQLQRITGTNSKLGKAGLLLSGFFAALESLTILQDPTASLEEKREALIETAAGLLTGTIAGLVGAAIGAVVLTAITGGIAAPITGFVGAVGFGVLGYYGGDMVGRAGAELLVRFLLSDTPVDPAGVINRLSAVATKLKENVGIDASAINKGINSAIDAINPFSLTKGDTSSEQSGALCDKKIDAYGYTVGVPNAGVAQATDGCKAYIINLTTPQVKKLVANNPFYAFATIPKGTYKTSKKDVTTFGVKATVVTSNAVEADLVYLVVKAVFENFDDFRKQHPAFAPLKKEDMIADGLSAPLHEGAIRYYKEAGLM